MSTKKTLTLNELDILFSSLINILDTFEPLKIEKNLNLRNVKVYSNMFTSSNIIVLYNLQKLYKKHNLLFTFTNNYPINSVILTLWFSE